MIGSAMVVTRFAPSPTGDLHLGHAYAAWFAWDQAVRDGGRFLLRIEDIDRTRCRARFVARHLEDLAWLGLAWEEPVVRQSARLAAYGAALAHLERMAVSYPCFCTRKEIEEEIARAAGAEAVTPGTSPVYPGTCRRLSEGERERRQAAGGAFAIRLDAERALHLTGPLTWEDVAAGRQAVDLGGIGDVVIARKEIPTSYHLAVVVDDAAAGVTLVTRGHDLFAATHVHRTLQALLALPVPAWHHHPLVTDETGRRLAKRDGDLGLRVLRAEGRSPREVLALAAATVR
ncbi:MAG: tRNA glutamyl-Q(34) synthetase GluQRS [Rhodospirillales bacterium]